MDFHWPRGYLHEVSPGIHRQFSDMGCDCSKSVFLRADDSHFSPPGPVFRTTLTKDADERVPELPTHGAVQDEINRVVQKRHHVQEVAEVLVYLLMIFFVQAAHERQHTLRKLRDQEEDDDGEQHEGGAVVLIVLVRLVLLPLILQGHPFLVGSVHCNN